MATLLRTLTFTLLATLIVGTMSAKKFKYNIYKLDAEDAKKQDIYNLDLPSDLVPTKPPRGPPSPPKLDPYRCDHFVDFKQTDVFLVFKARKDFRNCCRSFPRGTFTCPRTAPPGHICGLVNPPNCCTCPPLPPPTRPPTTTTTTTTEEPATQEDESNSNEEEEEEEEEEEKK